MEASFEVNGKEFKVDFSMLGSEKYYFNGVLLKKRRSYKFNDRLVFDTEEGEIEIAVSLSPKNWSTQAFFNNELIVEELFPEYKQKIEDGKNSKGIGKSGMFKNVILWCFLNRGFFTNISMGTVTLTKTSWWEFYSLKSAPKIPIC